MDGNAALLFTAAAERSGVSLDKLTDAVQIAAMSCQDYGPVSKQMAEVSRVPGGMSYEALTGSLESLVTYATGSDADHDGFAAVLEDCRLPNTAKFMHALVEILVESPVYFEGVALNVERLLEVERAIARLG